MNKTKLHHLQCHFKYIYYSHVDIHLNIYGKKKRKTMHEEKKLPPNNTNTF